jgi:hypothetical protein
MNRYSILLGLALVVVLGSCATIFTGSTQKVTIDSEPQKATVRINGLEQGTTPATIKLKKSNDPPAIVLEKEGYDDATFYPDHTFNGVAVLNLFDWLGWLIDFATGAMWKYSPSYYKVKLQPAE